MSDQHMHGGHGASGSKGHLRGVLLLSFSSLGIIYGDIGKLLRDSAAAGMFTNLRSA